MMAYLAQTKGGQPVLILKEGVEEWKREETTSWLLESLGRY